jgi:hypothetical protein
MARTLEQQRDTIEADPTLDYSLLATKERDRGRWTI